MLILGYGDPKFDSAALKDYAAGASIDWKIILTYNLKGNAKVERTIVRLKRAIQKVAVSIHDRNWNDCLGEILVGYRRRPETDGKFPFETLFGIGPRFTVEQPQLDLVAVDTDLAREFEIAISKSFGVSRTAPRVAEKWTNKF